MVCPSDETLACYVDRRLSIRESIDVVNHLADCSRCTEIVANVVKTMSEIGEPIERKDLRDYDTRPWSDLTNKERLKRQEGKGCDVCHRNGIGCVVPRTLQASPEGCDIVILEHVSAMGGADQPELLRVKICVDCRPRVEEFIRRILTELTT